MILAIPAKEIRSKASDQLRLFFIRNCVFAVLTSIRLLTENVKTVFDERLRVIFGLVYKIIPVQLRVGILVLFC